MERGRRKITTQRGCQLKKERKEKNIICLTVDFTNETVSKARGGTNLERKKELYFSHSAV